MSNVDVVKRVEEAWNSNQPDQLDQHFAAEFSSHAAVPGMPPGLAGAKMAHQSSMQSFPDRRMEIGPVFGDGDYVCSRTLMSGTNRGGVPWIGAPANGAKVQGMESISIYRLRDGKIVEHWGQNDIGSLMMQLGIMPAPPAGAGAPA